MKKTKAQSGITLIALVVTIVVLLILAGITIAYVLSDNGIFNTAKRAKIESEAGALRDYASNAQWDVQIAAVDPTRTAALDVDAVKGIVDTNFPDTYTGTDKANLTSITYESGKLGGKIENIKTDKFPTTTFTVDYTSGAPVVTWTDTTVKSASN